jgi:hypothetical protein
MSSYLHMSGDAAAEALRGVAAVRDDPARRLGLASRFYDDRPGCVSIRSYRRAEMAFMRWQVRRGLLAAPDAPRPGSEWWRAINEGLLRDAWEADQLLAGRPGPASRPSVSRWSGFLERPSAVAWYRAHNASIVAGYPLVGFTLSEILALENYVGRLIDYGVMLPRIQALYAFAAADLDESRLLGFVQDGLPAYAWTNDEDHPWTTSRSPRLRSVLRWLTSS